jgi:hypothetical protein
MTGIRLRGRNGSKYRPEFIDMINEAKDKYQGFTNYQLAQYLGISTGAFYNYMNRYPEFEEAVLEAHRKTDALLEHALFKAAKGHDIERVEEITDENGNLVNRKRTIQEVSPNVNALRYWLNNRTDYWRDRTEIAQLNESVIEVKLVDDINEKSETPGKGQHIEEDLQ